ncbi:MAG: hypothetical protein KDD65_17625 [Bacteroidetes bacterium]|nr:hypothetical protein [Bacteroidota bacterium]
MFRNIALAIWAGLASSTAAQQAFAQSSVLEIVSPLPGQMVGQDELLIVVRARDGRSIDPRSVELFIDDEDFTDEIKTSSESIRFLFRNGSGRRLKPGTHIARVTARLPDGTDIGDLEWRFLVDGSRASGAVAASRPALPIRGSTFIGTRNSDISGNRSLRQEPSAVYTVRTDLEAQYGAFTFPLKVFLTTDETNTAQPRNRFVVGARSKHLSVFVGDTNPRYSSLSLANTRARGAMAEVYLKPVRLSFTHGAVRRGIEIGDPSSSLVSPLLSAYERNITAARLALGGPKTVEFSLHALRAADDTTSGSSGSMPLQNIVAGSDLSVNFLKGRFGFAGGSAISVTTEDISRGVADKAEIDSLFDVDIPIDPADFRNIIILNTTTVPIRLDKLSSLAWYGEAHARALGHGLNAEYRSIGSSFFSAGNPYLINDRKILSISDRFRHLDGRLFGVIRYSRYSNFADDAFAIPLSNESISGSITVAPRNEVPTITVGYRTQARRRGTDELPLSNSRLNTFMLGTSKQIVWNRLRQNVQFSASLSTRADTVQPTLDNTALTTSIGFMNQLSRTLTTNLRYTRVGISYDNLDDRQVWHTGVGGATYQFEGFPLDLSGDVRLTHAGGSQLVSASDRYGFSVAGEYEVQPNMVVELRVGVDAYRDAVIEQARYTERYVTLRHRYTF